jgi:dihydroorotate dehydrogenase
MKPFGLDYEGATFVAKTTTLHPRAGNMPLEADGVSPKDLLPSCIKVKFLQGAVLNAVGLSGPGAHALLMSGKWQARERPFLISFMSVDSSLVHRMMELHSFVEMLKPHIPEFKSPFALEMNFSCPNVGLSTSELAEEAGGALDIAKVLGIPLVPNFGPDISVEIIREVMNHPACDAVSVSNTLKWGNLSHKINWNQIWGQSASPLSHIGGGGMSGNPIFPLVLEIAQRAKMAKLKKPLIVGGGVMSVEAAEILTRLGVSAVKLGVVGMLRPWRVRKIVRRVRELT